MFVPAVDPIALASLFASRIAVTAADAAWTVGEGSTTAWACLTFSLLKKFSVDGAVGASPSETGGAAGCCSSDSGLKDWADGAEGSNAGYSCLDETCPIIK